MLIYKNVKQILKLELDWNQIKIEREKEKDCVNLNYKNIKKY